MNIRKGVLLLVFISMFSSFVLGQPAFRDVGFEAYPWGIGFFGGFNPLDSLCFSYAWLIDFAVFFVFFYFVAHQLFGKERYKKGDLASLAVAFALSLGLARWAAFRGGIICGVLSGGASGFGNIFGLLLILGLIFLILWAFVKGSNAGRLFASVAYIIFYFWLGSEGGYIISGWFYYIPADPYFIINIMKILLIVAFVVGVISLGKWYKEGAK